MRNHWVAGRPLVLYGAGKTGGEVLQVLRSHGISVAAFIDAGAVLGQFREGIPVYTLNDWAASGQKTADVLITILSHTLNVAPIIETLRQTNQFLNIMSMMDYANLFPDDLGGRFWLAPASHYAGKEDNLAAARACFQDPLSLQWYDAILRFASRAIIPVFPNPQWETNICPLICLDGWSPCG